MTKWHNFSYETHNRDYTGVYERKNNRQGYARQCYAIGGWRDQSSTFKEKSLMEHL